MKKVFQTIVDKGKGNCMQAAFASLFELDMTAVPNFIAYEGKWFNEFFNFVNTHGYQFDGTLYNNKDLLLKSPDFYETNKTPVNRFHQLKDMEGVNGYFYASVYSPNYYIKGEKRPAMHAVIINKDLEIVHDPNKGYSNITEYPEFETIGYKGVVNVFMINPKE